MSSPTSRFMDADADLPSAADLGIEIIPGETFLLFY